MAAGLAHILDVGFKCLKRPPLRARTGYKQVSGFSLEYSKADGTLTTQARH
jgi:hypothetical protein